MLTKALRIKLANHLVACLEDCCITLEYQTRTILPSMHYSMTLLVLCTSVASACWGWRQWCTNIPCSENIYIQSNSTSPNSYTLYSHFEYTYSMHRFHKKTMLYIWEAHTRSASRLAQSSTQEIVATNTSNGGYGILINGNSNWRCWTKVKVRKQVHAYLIAATSTDRFPSSLH